MPACLPTDDPPFAAPGAGSSGGDRVPAGSPSAGSAASGPRGAGRFADHDDAGLVAACRRGREDAWNALVDRYARLVVSIPRRHGLGPDDADDVAQGVFLQLFRRLETLDDANRLASWLITTAHRETWRVGRRRGRDAAFEARFDDLAEPDPDDAARWERSDLVRRGLERLGGRCEALLRALFAEDAADYASIGAALDMPVGSIGPTRARCFAKLERILGDLGLRRDEDADDDGHGRGAAARA